MENKRKTPRASWLNYDEGIYFITVCTAERVHYFGEIHDGVMYLSGIGRFLDSELVSASTHNDGIKVLTHVVMPNHFHALLDLNVGPSVPSVSDSLVTYDMRNPNPAKRPDSSLSRHVPKLSRYVNMLKGSVKRKASRERISFAWQSRYHDHLVRNSGDFYRIVDYIDHNVAKWHADCFNDLTH